MSKSGVSSARSTVRKTATTSSEKKVSAASSAAKRSSGRERTGADFKRLDPREHVLERPGMWIDSTESVERTVLCWNGTEQPEDGLEEGAAPRYTLYERKTLLPYAVEKLIIEVVNNAGDSIIDDRLVKRSEKREYRIAAELDGNRVSVTNYGNSLPLDFNEEENMHTPQLVFGVMLVSSSFTKAENLAGGTNGVGAKLANIFSDEFEIEICDGQRTYRQRWWNNMTECSEPVITEEPGELHVRVSYIFDRKYFKVEGYPPETAAIFRAHVLAVALSTRCPCTFRAGEGPVEHIEVPDILALASRIKTIPNATGAAGDKTPCFLWYDWGAKRMKMVRDERGVETPANSAMIPRFELAVFDTPDSNPKDKRIFSYVNGIETTEGGSHVKAVFAVLKKVLAPIIGFKPKKPQLAKRVTIILSCRIPNPQFASQTKKKLTSHSDLVFPVPPATTAGVARWTLVETLKNAQKAQQWKTKASSKSVHTEIPDLVDALDARRPGNGCTLVLVEGKSAKGFALTAYSDREKYGIFPLRGKGLNLINAKEERILKNKEVGSIIMAMGLQPDVDYRNDENYNKLRYQKVHILPDSDVDGTHILALYILMLWKTAPTFVMRPGTVFLHRTIKVKATKGKSDKQEVCRFYSTERFHAWETAERESGTLGKWHIKYYKGLGTSTDVEIVEEAKDPFLVELVYNDKVDDTLEMVFSSKRAADRKRWIEEEVHDESIYDKRKIAISDVLRKELVLFARTNTERSIVAMDGLKESQRKGIYVALEYWDYKESQNEYKVQDFASWASKRTGYHYGPNSLAEMTNAICRNYTGSNNLSLLHGTGNFGSRLENGKDASSGRYTHVIMNGWLPSAVRREDEIVLDIIDEEGMKKEPRRLYPLLPLQLVNGSIGIGTGHASRIPGCNPHSIIAWLRARLSGQPLPDVQPWIRGFKGTVSVVQGKEARALGAVRHVAEDAAEAAAMAAADAVAVVMSDVENVEAIAGAVEAVAEADTAAELAQGVGEATAAATMVVRGSAEVIAKDTICVTEIPPSISIQQYVMWLNKRVEKKEIRDYSNLSTKFEPEILIYGLVEKPVTARNVNKTEAERLQEQLNLVRRMELSNMVVLDDDDRPRRFATIASFLEAWYKWRLARYRLRKSRRIDEWERTIVHLRKRFELLDLINKKMIDFQRDSTEEMLAVLQEHDIDTKLVSNLNLLKLGRDSRQNVQKKLDSEQANLDAYRKLRPEDIYLRELDELETDIMRYEQRCDAEREKVYQELRRKEPSSAKKGKGRRKKVTNGTTKAQNEVKA